MSFNDLSALLCLSITPCSDGGGNVSTVINTLCGLEMLVSLDISTCKVKYKALYVSVEVHVALFMHWRWGEDMCVGTKKLKAPDPHMALGREMMLCE